MEGYITLIEREGKKWELTVKLPVKWLQQFAYPDAVEVFGHTLMPDWGREVVEDNVRQPWRQLSQGYTSIHNAERAAAEIMAEIQEAKEGLVPKGYVKYTLDLTPDGPLVPLREGNQAADNEPF